MTVHKLLQLGLHISLVQLISLSYLSENPKHLFFLSLDYAEDVKTFEKGDVRKIPHLVVHLQSLYAVSAAQQDVVAVIHESAVKHILNSEERELLHLNLQTWLLCWLFLLEALQKLAFNVRILFKAEAVDEAISEKEDKQIGFCEVLN